MTSKVDSTDSFIHHVSSFGDQIKIAALFMSFMGLMLAVCVLSGTICVVLGGALLRASSLQAVATMLGHDLAIVGAVGGSLAYCAMIWTLQLKLFEYLHERSVKDSGVWKVLVLVYNKLMALSFGCLTGLLGQLIYQPTTVSTSAAVLAGFTGALMFVAAGALSQAVFWCWTRKLVVFYEPWLPLPHQCEWICQYLLGLQEAAGVATSTGPPAASSWLPLSTHEKKEGSSASSCTSKGHQGSSERLPYGTSYGPAHRPFRNEVALASAETQAAPREAKASQRPACGEPDYDSMPDLLYAG